MNQEMNQEMYARAMQKWVALAEHYGYEKPVPENVDRCMKAILDAPDLSTASKALERAEHVALVAILAAWAKGRIPGPESVLNLERRAKKAESLAKMLEEKGQVESANNQRARALEMRDKIKNLLEEKDEHNVEH